MGKKDLQAHGEEGPPGSRGRRTSRLTGKKEGPLLLLLPASMIEEFQGLSVS